MDTTSTTNHREPWNKGKLVGQKAPLRPKDIWAIRVARRPRRWPSSGRRCARKAVCASSTPICPKLFAMLLAR